MRLPFRRSEQPDVASDVASDAATADSQDSRIEGASTTAAADTRLSLVTRAEAMATRASRSLPLRIRKKQADAAVSQQTNSPLFRLPYELRESIWKYALTPPYEAGSAHFHLYDEIYDCCTYEHPQDTQKRQDSRGHLVQMSLLVTWKAIYEETVQILYQNSDFTLVLFPGLARPRNHLSGKRCLGTPKKCGHLFQRMRRVTIIVQPGEKANTRKDISRIAELLKLIESGRRMSYLALQFNWQYRMHVHDANYKSREAIVKAFYPLKVALGPRLKANKRKKVKELEFVVKISMDPKASMQPSLYKLRAGFGKECQIIPCFMPFSTYDPTKTHVWGDGCLERGAFGARGGWVQARRSRIAQQRRTDTVVLDAYFLAWPVSFPVTLAACVNRKRYKGEL